MAETIIDACRRAQRELYDLSAWIYNGHIQNADEIEEVRDMMQACEEFLDLCNRRNILDLLEED